MGMLDKGMTHVPGRWSGTAGDFITLLRMVHTLKLMSAFFWNFQFNIFEWRLTAAN